MEENSESNNQNSDGGDKENNLKRKQGSTRATIQHKWTDEQINKLIEAVEERQPIWNQAEKAYHNRNTKDLLWKEICEDVFQQQIDSSEIVSKWNNLRVQFRTYDSKYNGTKSGQAYAPKQKWQFYDALQF